MQQINAYLIFDGTCREAMTFYAKALDAELAMFPFSEMPGGAPPGTSDRLMHAKVSKGAAVLMASDAMPGGSHEPNGSFSVSIACDSVEETDRIFKALSEGAKKITMPLQETFWSARFAMLTDRFGIDWMLNLEKKPA